MGDFDRLLQQRRATVCERGQCNVVGVRRQLNKDWPYTELVSLLYADKQKRESEQTMSCVRINCRRAPLPLRVSK